MSEEPMHPDQNPYLQGNFTPVDMESTCTDFEVIGEIPKSLHGTHLP